MDGVSVEQAKEAMRLAMHKLPIKCRFVTRAEQEAVSAPKDEPEAAEVA
jgi:large subunit ribosomal protein L16